MPGENLAECGENCVRTIRDELLEERLVELGLNTLAERRHPADMVMVNKIPYCMAKANSTTPFGLRRPWKAKGHAAAPP